MSPLWSPEMKLSNIVCIRQPQRRSGRWIWLLAALAAALCGNASADDYLDPLGGTGGSPFDAHCPANQLLTGFELRTGDDVDGIRPLCVIAHGPRDVSAATAEDNWTGGPGAGTTNVVCPRYKPIVTGLAITSEGAESIVVNNIDLYCGVAAETQDAGNLPLARFGAPTYDGGFHQEYSQTQHCPMGQVAVGVLGRSGIWLDAIGLICGSPPVMAKPEPPAKAEPQVQGKTIGKVTVAPGKIPLPARTAYLYIVDADGKLTWHRHDGAGEGKFKWQEPRVVGTDWGNFRQVFAGGNGVIYAITQRGVLVRYEHAGFSNGLGKDDPDSWRDPQQLATGWGNYTQAFSVGHGVIYAIAADGTLKWFRHTGSTNGRATLEGPRDVGTGWTGFKVFSGGDGVIYTITADGTLWWYRHYNYLTGAPGAWSERKKVGSGWADFERVFSTGDGIVYVVTHDGKLMWHHHKGYQDGRFDWDPPAHVGTGWGGRRAVIAQIDTTSHGPPICDSARNARARNSPVAPNLEAQCRAAGGTP